MTEKEEKTYNCMYDFKNQKVIVFPKSLNEEEFKKERKNI